MLKQLLLTGTTAIALFSGNVIAQAQTEPTPMQQPATQTEISTPELQQFASVVQQIQVIQQQSQQRMVQEIESSGLSTERFVEILQAQQTPDAESATTVSEGEMERFQQANTRLAEIQQQSQVQMQEAVTSEGLEVERFNQILIAVQQNPQLQQQVQQLFQN